MSDLKKPTDPFSLVGDSWPSESESAYHKAKVVADDAATTASTQAQSARDAESRMSDEQGKTASAVSSGYGSAASDLQEESITYATISAWMTDAEGKIRSAKTSISDLVSVGTVEVREALDSEVKGVPATPSSSELIAKYQGEIASVKTKLGVELDGIGHSLHGDPGASRTPSYTSIPTTPTPEHADPHASMASYTGTPGAPVPEPHQLPPMPRATTTQPAESPNATSTPSVPAAPHPTLSNLIGGGQGSTPTGSPGGTSTPSPHASSQGSPSPQAHQSTEQRQTPKAPGLPHIPSLPLDGLPAAAAESIATVVSSATAHQLSTTTITPSAPTVPASTGITPGVPGTPPATPVTPTPLTPIGGGGLSAPAVTQPAPQGTPASPPAAPQQSPTAPSPPRSPVADVGWIQKTYGLSPGVEVPKSDTSLAPALFIADLPDDAAHLHRALGTLRQQFEQVGWSQPLVVASLRRGFESKTVYVTADGVSIHPHGVLLSHGVTPLDEMAGAPACSELSGSIMVTEKLRSLVPRGWTVESLLSTVPADENHQTVEQYQELIESGELLEYKVSRGRDDVTAEEAMSVFARAAIGSGGCSDLDTESSRLKAARWVGMQPVDYLGLLGRWYLADAAESMSRGNWGDAVYCSERYLSLVDTKKQVA